MRQLHLCALLTLLVAKVTCASAGYCTAVGDTDGAPSCTQPARAGIALLQRLSQTSKLANPGPETVSKVSKTSNSSSIHGGPCTGIGCGESSEALVEFLRLPAPEAAVAPVTEAEAPRVPANRTVTSKAQEDSSSYSLSSAGEGGGLSGSVWRRQEAGFIDEEESDNASLPPLAEERFEPFGYPGAGLLLELHLPEVTLKELHSSSRGSLAQFLLEVRGELNKSAEVVESRISILGIHGRYKRYDTSGLYHMSSERTGHITGPSHVDEEVVVRFEILPGWADDPDPRQALNVLTKQLHSSKSDLMRGPLGTILVNATVGISAPVSIATQPQMVEHRGMAHMSAMAWPIGISAAFIGVLIWLAAY
jgi:hypothetical protein